MLIGASTPTDHLETHTTCTHHLSYPKCRSVRYDGEFLRLQPARIQEALGTVHLSVATLKRALANSRPAAATVHEVERQVAAFELHMPLISALCNQSLRTRHWQQIDDETGFKFQANRTFDLTLSSLLTRFDFTPYLKQLEAISAVATQENEVEQALERMTLEFSSISLPFLSHAESGVPILDEPTEVLELLEKQTMNMQQLKNSPFVKPFSMRTSSWDGRLRKISEIMDTWLLCQRRWLQGRSETSKSHLTWKC